MRIIIKNTRGLFYTLGILLILLPLILLVSYYATMERTPIAGKIESIRCDELHYFVEDVREDLKRANVIFGRRAAIYAINEVVSTGNTLSNYSFNCTPNCGVDCDSFTHPNWGSEAAIAELAVCGTLYGENVTYMLNHTLSQWLGRIRDHGEEMHFNLSITMNDINIVPKDAYTFAVMTNATYVISDSMGVCFYRGENVQTNSFTSITGLEDPTHTLQTNAFIVRYINNCSIDLNLENVAGCSEEDLGWGLATGRAVFISDLTNAEQATYCTDHADEINETILVIDTSFGASPCVSMEPCCFNISCSNHLAGAINYDVNRVVPFVEKCDMSIPWITGTGDMDNSSTQNPGWARPVGCDISNFSNGSCIYVENNPYCGTHRVLLGYDWDKYNTTCFQPSNVSLYGGFDGPSFFDRLDGNLNLTEYYRNQSIKYFNNSFIGLETIVNPVYFMKHGVSVNHTYSWVDYMYWQGRGGCAVEGVCHNNEYVLKVDDNHSHSLNVNTKCAKGRSCPSGSEYCMDCLDDDGDGVADWLDSDCNALLLGCGTRISCDPADIDHCATCYDQAGRILDPDGTLTCSYYGYNTTEWHMYEITPADTGYLNVSFTGNSPSPLRSDLIVYNYSIDSNQCLTPLRVYDMEPSASAKFCVTKNKKYVIAVDVDATDCSHEGEYTLETEFTVDAACN